MVAVPLPAGALSARLPLMLQLSVNAVPVRLTALLKLNTMVDVASTLTAPLAGTVDETVGGVSMVNAVVAFAAMLVPARSAICVATAVAVQVSPAGMAALGVRVMVAVPLPAGALSVRLPLMLQLSVNAVPVRLTALLKLNTMVDVASTLTAPSAGTVDETVGGVSTVNENT